MRRNQGDFLWQEFRICNKSPKKPRPPRDFSFISQNEPVHLFLPLFLSDSLNGVPSDRRTIYLDLLISSVNTSRPLGRKILFMSVLCRNFSSSILPLFQCSHNYVHFVFYTVNFIPGSFLFFIYLFYPGVSTLWDHFF